MKYKKKIFIFGASQGGIEAFEVLKVQYEIIGFVDNDENKWGNKLKGKIIYSPKELYHYSKDIKIHIASMYYDEILLQLKEMGFNNFSYFRQKYNFKYYIWYEYFMILLYPFFLIVINPIRLLQTLYSSLVLFNGNWGDYSQFDPKTGLNSLFYRTAAINLYRYGRNGISSLLSTGKYPLFKWFHFSLPSLYAYWIGGPVILLFGIFGWLLIHTLWIGNVNLSWLFIVLFMALISTNFYVNGFVLQNYNILGWLFFPVGLFGLLTQNWIITGVGWLLATFASITVFFIAIIFVLVFAIQYSTLIPLFTIIPAGLKIIINFWPIFANGNVVKVVCETFKSIGFVKQKSKYARLSMRLDGKKIFNLILYLQFLFFYYILVGEFSWLILIGISIYLLNSLFARFADEQSMFMMMFSIATAIILQTPKSLMLIPYWLLISPPQTILLFGKIDFLKTLPKLKPFYVKPYVKAIEDFLEKVPSGSKILVAFENPNGVYEKIFDGWRYLFELLLYVGTKKEILIMPNWYTVFENNYDGAEELWGRDVKSVLNNVQKCNIDYVILYQVNQDQLDPIWKKSEFMLESTFIWNQFDELSKDLALKELKKYSWWLLRVKR